MTLKLAETNAVLDAAMTRAAELEIRISVAVCDAGGRLLGFQRMDGGHWAAGYGAQGKAVASAAFCRPSGLLAERAAAPIMTSIAEAEGGHMSFAKGAVPIVVDGVVVGACGVGGGTGDQDEECAVAGAAALEAGRA